MGKIIYGKEPYKNFGECLTVTNGLFEMYITIEKGPRIIKFNPIGKENVMFEDIDRASSKPAGSLAPFYGEDDEWFIYGGHRFWISPESWPETYYPDNDRVGVEICGNTVTLSPPVQRVTGLCEKLVLTFSEVSMTVSVKHILENRGESPKECAIWAITVLSQHGICVVPQSDENTGLLSNRTLMLWPYTDLQDSRLCLGNRYIGLRQDTDARCSLKFGINNRDGEIYYFNHGYCFKKSFITDHKHLVYPDNGCSCEVYTNRLFLEAESLGALAKLEPGDKTVHTEIWQLTNNIEMPDFSEIEFEKCIIEL